MNYVDRETALRSIAASRGQACADVARTQLGILSLLAEPGVPVRWLHRVGGDRPTARHALSELASSGLCQLSEDGTAVLLLHPGGRLSSRAPTEAAEEPSAEAAAAGAPSAAGAAPAGPGLGAAEPASIPEDYEREAAALLGSISIDQAQGAEAQRQEVQDLTRQLCALAEQDHSRHLLADDQVVAVLAHTIRNATRLDPSQQVVSDLARPVSTLLQVLGPEHPHTLTAGFALAGAYRAAGQPTKAISLYEQVVEGTVRLLGPDHPHTLTARFALASAHRTAGEPARAVPLYEELVEEATRLLGSSHPDTLSSRNNLAQAYESAGRSEQALTLYEELVHDAEDMLNQHHPYLSVFKRNLERARQSPEEQAPAPARKA